MPQDPLPDAELSNKLQIFFHATVRCITRLRFAYSAESSFFELIHRCF